MTAKKLVPMVVTTSHRGVFFGYGVPRIEKSVRLKDARMCVYWSSDVKGIVGLAKNGPTKSCKVTPAAPVMTLSGVTSIMEVSPEAAAAWEVQPWGA